ncbi:ferritin-like domain-containing protein [Pantoea ananatis]|uniref:YciE/YciF ferroxidase family protein n=1 Tax=Pantoea ananas TaxID=553 RepID=UPI00352AB383
MTVKTLNDLFIHDLADIYSAEKQIARALPKMARAASDEHLVAAFNQHLEETRGQIERLDEFVEVTPEIKIKRMKCHALEGLAEEAQEIIESVEKGEVRVKGLIAAAQKVEHYEIATYGTLQALALKPGYTKAAKLLALTLEEEKQTDVKLTTLAQAISTVEGATK